MNDKLMLSDIGESSAARTVNVRIYKRTHGVLNSLADRTGMSVESLANFLICLAASDFDIDSEQEENTDE